MRCPDRGVRDASDGIIARSMKQWVNSHRPPTSTKRQIMGRAAAMASGDGREPELWSIIFHGLRETGGVLYRVLAREPRLLSVPVDGSRGSRTGNQFYMANYELLYSSSGGVGMLSLMG